MAPASPAEHAEALEVLEAQVRECFGRVVYSHKTHEKNADDCLTRLSRVKLSQIVLSAITTGGLIVAIFGDSHTSKIAAIVSAFLSSGLLALNAYTKDVDPGRSAERHSEAAAKLWMLRESYLSLLTDIRAGDATSDTVRERRDELQKELAAIYENAPRTTIKGYLQASDALKHRAELTFSDSEIDKFLPAALHRPPKIGAGDF